MVLPELQQFPLEEIIKEYGIFAVFALCTIEGDITLLLSGVIAQSGYFGNYSFLKVLLFGTAGGMAGDTFGYLVGRMFRETVKHYRFYQMAEPRIERLIEKFGGYSVIISKYLYGIRVAMCLFYGMGRMPFWRFLALDAISCGLWVFLLAGAEYFFGLDWFFPHNQVTELIYLSKDLVGHTQYRIPGPFANAHAYGGTMVMGLPLLLGLQRGPLTVMPDYRSG